MLFPGDGGFLTQKSSICHFFFLIVWQKISYFLISRRDGIIHRGCTSIFFFCQNLFLGGGGVEWMELLMLGAIEKQEARLYR